MNIEAVEAVEAVLDDAELALEGTDGFPEMENLLSALITRKEGIEAELEQKESFLRLRYDQKVFDNCTTLALEFREVVEAIKKIASAVETAMLFTVLSEVAHGGMNRQPPEAATEEDADLVENLS